MFYINEAALSGNSILSIVNKACPVKYTEMQFHAIITDTSSDVQFYLRLKDGDKLVQCFTLADDDVLNEDALDKMQEEVANAVRSDSKYASGKINEVILSVVGGKVKTFERNTYDKGSRVHLIKKEWKSKYIK